MNKELLMEKLSHIYDLLSDLIEDLDDDEPVVPPRTLILVQIGEYEMAWDSCNVKSLSLDDPQIQEALATAHHERLRLGYPEQEETHLFVRRTFPDPKRSDAWTQVIKNKEFNGEKENG